MYNMPGGGFMKTVDKGLLVYVHVVCQFVLQSIRCTEFVLSFFFSSMINFTLQLNS